MTKNELDALARCIAAAGSVDADTLSLAAGAIERERPFAVTVVEFVGGPSDGLRLNEGLEAFQPGFVYSVGENLEGYHARGVTNEGVLFMEHIGRVDADND